MRRGKGERMAGLIERYAKTEGMIRQRIGIRDGKAEWTRIPCLCMSFETSRTEFEDTGRLSGGIVFYVAPLEKTPELPGWIDCGEKEYEIKEIRVCRNLNGRLLGYRIATAGAG